MPFNFDLTEVSRESHTVSRTRHIPATSIPEVMVVLTALIAEGFIGPVTIHMSQGGFSDIMTEESIRLVPNDDICSTIK